MNLNYLIWIIVLVKSFQKVFSNDFPSLLVANASVAILVDHEYLDSDYDMTLSSVRGIIEKVLREDLRDGGLTVKYYPWTDINFNKDFTAVISITNCKNTWKTFFKAMQEKLVFIALTDNDCPRLPVMDAVMIPIMNTGQELPQIILDIRSYQAVNWKTSILLYDHALDRDSVNRVVSALSSESPDVQTISLSISMFKIKQSDRGQYDAIRKTLTSFTTNYIGTNFLVITTNPGLVIEVASELDMIDSTSQWFFILASLDQKNTSSLTASIREGGNIALAVNDTSEATCVSPNRMCHFEELFKIFALALSKMVREEAAIYSQISDEEWEAIRQSKKERRDSILEYIRNHLRGNRMCTTCSRWKFQSSETWGRRFTASMTSDKLMSKMLNVGHWEPTNGLMLNDSLFPHIAHGFRNKTIPIVTYHNPPWQIIDYNENNEIVMMKGVVIHILNELAEKLNFTYFIMDPTRNKNYTLINDDFIGNNTGSTYQSTLNIPNEVLELIINRKVMFGAIGVTINDQYRQAINFTRPISVQSYSLLISRPKELGRLYLFTAPFSGDTWLCLTFTIVIIGPLLYGVNFISPYNEHFKLVKKGGLYKIQNCYWYIYGALLQQGGMYLPKSDSARLIVGTWWLVVLVVVTTYCGNLVAFLTFPKIDTPISNINELLKYKNFISWSIRGDSYLQDYLKDTDDDKYKSLNESATFHTLDSLDFIEKVRLGKHVYIDWKTNLQYIMKREFLETDRCDFGLGAEEFLDERIALILPSESPYMKILNKEIYRMLQMGFIQKWLTEYLPKKDRCWNIGKSAEIENHTVNLNDMQGCFLVLLTGTSASVVLIIIEYIWRKRTLSRAKKIVKPFSE